MSVMSVRPSSHLILCRPLLLPPSIFPSIRVFSRESALRIRWPKDWSFSFSISPSSEHSGVISFRMDWLDLQVSCKGQVPIGRAFERVVVVPETTTRRQHFFVAHKVFLPFLLISLVFSIGVESISEVMLVCSVRELDSVMHRHLSLLFRFFFSYK